MKHYVVRNVHSNLAEVSAAAAERTRYIDIILRHSADKASAEIIVEFYRALNTLMDAHSYVVNLRVLAEEKVGGPLYWGGRTAIFLGDWESSWCPIGEQRAWAAQVMNLSPRILLVGGAAMLLAQISDSERKVAAIHPSFETAAWEHGIVSCGQATCISANGRLHSAITCISALRLLAEFVSMDHGEHLADALCRFVGLKEPEKAIESQITNRLIRKANGDELVSFTLATMLDNIEEPLKISELSEAVGASTRQLQRRYLSKTGAKLLDTYKELRLERAHSLLKHTDMPLAEIATATGFTSRSAMSRAFFKYFKIRPEVSRNQRYLGNAPV